MYHHRNIRVLVHGDDFTLSDKEKDLLWIFEAFKSKYMITVRGIFGPEAHDMKSTTVS